MNILVIGGSYFLGRWFVNHAYGKHNITVFNRGNYKIGLDGIIQIRGDRHNRDDLQSLKELEIDTVVDFCAYQPTDISNIFEVLGKKIRQYIFISTVDVYEHGLEGMIDETAPLERRSFDGEVGNYIAGKVALEGELVKCATEYGVCYTTFRPAILYGPGNYAPREKIYFHWIKEAGQILHPIDATGYFQLVYVEDVAKAILQAVGNEVAYNEAFNLCQEECETYDIFEQALQETVPIPFEKVNLAVAMIAEQEIPLPFPLTKFESNHYAGQKALQLIGQYTSLIDGMKQAVAAEGSFCSE